MIDPKTKARKVDQENCKRLLFGYHTTNIFDEDKIIEDRRIRKKTTTWNTALATYLSQLLFFVSLAATLVAAA